MMMSSFEVYLDIRQPAPEAAKPSSGSGVPLRRAETGQHGGTQYGVAAAGRFYSFARVLYSASAAAAARHRLVAVPRQLYVWCMEAMNRTLCYFID